MAPPAGLIITTMGLLLWMIMLVPSSYAIIQNDTGIHESTLSSSCASRRTIWMIITSYVTTLFACAWTAIHPNMPGPLEGGVVIAIRRLSIMMLALVAPEIVLMWAARQFFSACTVQKRFQKALQDGTLELRVKPNCEPRLVSARVPCEANEVRVTIPEEKTESCSSRSIMSRRTSRVREKLGPSSISIESLRSYCRWTLKHSFYAWMGGFMLFIDKDPALPREVYHPLTPEELFNFLEAGLVQMSMISEGEIDDRSKGDWLSKTVAIMQLVWFVAQLVARGFGGLATTQLEIDALAISTLSCFTYAFWWYKPKDVRCPVPVYWKEPGELPKVTYSIPQSVAEFLGQWGLEKSWIGDRLNILRPLLNLQGLHSISDDAVKAHRVPYFCGYLPETDKGTVGQNLPVYAIGALTGVVFGSIHCVAWNFAFPTHTEQVLWRVSSLTMTLMPGLSFAGLVYAYLVIDGGTLPHAAAVMMWSFATTLLYVVCRLTVAVLVLLSLRSLPAGVYDELCWTSLVPHW